IDEAAPATDRKFILPIQLDCLADIEWRGRLVVSYVAQCCEAGSNSLTLFVRDGVTPHIAALHQQTRGKTAAHFDLKTVVGGVSTIPLEQRLPVRQRRVHLK